MSTFSVDENAAEMSDGFAAHIYNVTAEETNRQGDRSEQMWIQSDSTQLQGIGDEMSLSQLNVRPLATYTESNFVAQSTNRNAREPRVNATSSADADFNSNHIAINKAHI